VIVVAGSIADDRVNWIIGTAGHIDHGKTSLVKALTGQDTDRLKEERERGISIDLGFAHLDLPDGTRAGVVDVPGHERFIRNMLAGAHGFDLVLFTVAADDGVMPQTEEHLDIVHFLGVSHAIFVVTKADLASRARIAEVAAEIRALVAGSSLEGSPVVPFSFVTSEGLDPLRALIAERLRAGTKAPSVGYFRLPVDRAFASPGHGLIVTGTAVSGEVRLGDKVRCLPNGELWRVRGLEVHNHPVDVARSGQRIALNLSGSHDAAIARGDVVCHEKITLSCDRFDVRLEIRPTAKAGIKSHQHVRVYVGTAERLGTVIPLGSPEKPAANSVGAGESAYCQIAVSEPVQVLRGDHVVVRNETAQWTLGGGIVLVPAASKHKRSDPALLDRLLMLDRGDDPTLAAALIDEGGEFAIPLSGLAQRMNRREDDVRERLQGSNAIRVFSVDGETQYALERDCRRIEASLLETLRAWHAEHALASGMDIEEARASLPVRVSLKPFRLLIQDFEKDRSLVREGSLLRLPGHRVEVPAEDVSLVERIGERLGRSRLAPPDLRQLVEDLGIDRRKLSELLRAMEKQRTLVMVAADLWFRGDAIDWLRSDLTLHLSTAGSIAAGEFRDRYQTSRKYAIPLLEFFDREGLTVRVGDVRRLRKPRLTERA
jgi:selenocysteine-specific elongation factor